MLRGVCRVDINEKVLHYLLKMPPALEIQSMVCESLVFTVPWTRPTTDPLVVEFTNVKVVVAEVDHVTEQYDSMPEVDYILELILFVVHHQTTAPFPIDHTYSLLTFLLMLAVHSLVLMRPMIVL